MKKILLIIVLLCSVNMFSLDHGLIAGFEVGYNMEAINKVTKYGYTFEDDYSDSLSIKMTTGYRIENLRIIGEYTNTLKYVDIDGYNPIQDNFKIEISYTFENIKIGFYHWCNHPVITTSDQRESLSNSGQRSVYISYYKEF